ncbi:MAG: CotH kinase family protein [Mobilitalea sp.]
MKSKRAMHFLLGILVFAVIFVVLILAVTAKQKSEGLPEEISEELSSESDKIEATSSEIPSEESKVFATTFDQDYGKVGEALTVSVTGVPQGKLLQYKWTVNGKIIADNTSNQYLLTEADLESLITVTVTADGEAATTSAELYFSKLPVFYINTEQGRAITSKDIDVNATLKIQGNDTYNQSNSTLYDGNMTITGRGNSTWMVEKKPYKIKLDSKTNLFGLGKNKKWVLLANFYDQSLIRNMLAYDLAGQIGFESPKFISAEVVMNGKYIGNYLFCDQIEIAADRIDIFDWEAAAEEVAKKIVEADASLTKDMDPLEEALNTDLSWITSGTLTYKEVDYTIADYITISEISGGYLLELDDTFDEVSKFRTKAGQPIMFKSPEYAKTNAEMLTYVTTYIQSFEDAVNAKDFYTLYQDKRIHYSELFDMNSLVDFWILTEVFSNLDTMFKSTYMYQDIGGLFEMGPIWDFDLSAGGSSVIEFTDYSHTWQTTYRKLSTAQAVQWYRDLIGDPYFVLKAYERYHSIRSTLIEDMVKEEGTIDELEAMMMEAGTANIGLWPSNSFWNRNTNIPLYADKVEEVRSWLDMHLTWLDTQFESYETLLASLGTFKTSEDLIISNITTVGKQISITVKVSDEKVKQLAVYYNGRYMGEADVTNKKAIYNITPVMLVTLGGSDIIQVRPIDAEGNIVSSGTYKIR